VLRGPGTRRGEVDPAGAFAASTSLAIVFGAKLGCATMMSGTMKMFEAGAKS
jgi:hypothetical protein